MHSASARLAAAEAAIDALRCRVEALERAASLWPPEDRECEACRGRGLERPPDVTCGVCNGLGRVALQPSNGRTIVTLEELKQFVDNCAKKYEKNDDRQENSAGKDG